MVWFWEGSKVWSVLCVDIQGGRVRTLLGAERGERASSSSSRDVASDWGAQEHNVSSRPLVTEFCGAPCSSL